VGKPKVYQAGRAGGRMWCVLDTDGRLVLNCASEKEVRDYALPSKRAYVRIQYQVLRECNRRAARSLA